MIPKDALNKISLVIIYHHISHYIYGFSFLDKNRSLLWKIGNTASWMSVKYVELAENEFIVGVTAKLS